MKSLLFDINQFLLSLKLTIFNLPIKVFLSNFILNKSKKYNYSINITLGFPLSNDYSYLLILILKYFLQNNDCYFSVYNFDININIEIKSYFKSSNFVSLNLVKNIIAIASCKGGVGKSLITANLARCLSFNGSKVGILDADIYGSSQPALMNTIGLLPPKFKQNIKPFVCNGIKMISIGNLVDINSSLIWRGPMISKAFINLLSLTEWGVLDYLLIDLPPGTGDIHLTMIKNIPITGVLIVTTPNNLSIINTKRSIMMFKKTHHNIIGLIENMNFYVCDSCEEHSFIFGNKLLTKELIKSTNIEYLGGIPLSNKFSLNQNNNDWHAFTDSNYELSRYYQCVALKISYNVDKFCLSNA